MSGLVLATVGTTKFDALVQALDSAKILQALADKGFKELLLQKGNGDYRISHIVPCPLPGFSVRRLRSVVDYLPHLGDVLKRASLVISHCGAGSAFEALTEGKPLIVVPNPLLMDNHQEELASLLSDAGHLVHCAPEGLEDAIRKMDASKLKPYSPGNTEGIVQAIESLFQL